MSRLMVNPSGLLTFAPDGRLLFGGDTSPCCCSGTDGCRCMPRMVSECQNRGALRCCIWGTEFVLRLQSLASWRWDQVAPGKLYTSTVGGATSTAWPIVNGGMLARASRTINVQIRYRCTGARWEEVERSGEFHNEAVRFVWAGSGANNGAGGVVTEFVSDDIRSLAWGASHDNVYGGAALRPSVIAEAAWPLATGLVSPPSFASSGLFGAFRYQDGRMDADCGARIVLNTRDESWAAVPWLDGPLLPPPPNESTFVVASNAQTSCHSTSLSVAWDTPIHGLHTRQTGLVTFDYPLYVAGYARGTISANASVEVVMPCAANPCPPPTPPPPTGPNTKGCCRFFSGGSGLTTAVGCLTRGVWMGLGVPCIGGGTTGTPDEGNPYGACTLPSGGCVVTTDTDCRSMRGIWGGGGSTCGSTGAAIGGGCVGCGQDQGLATAEELRRATRRR